MQDLYRQTKSGIWHLLYCKKPNCNRYGKDPIWAGDAVEKDKLPKDAIICKKCKTSNQ